VFFPEFDQVYPLLAMLMVICWVKALNGSRAYAFYLGITLFVSTFFAYNLLTAGVFLAYYGIYWLWRQRSSRAIAKLVMSAGIALALWAGIYAALWGATGYDPFASLRSALASQAVFAGYLHRSYIRCAIYDPYDFAMGAGFIAVVIIGLYLWRNARPFDGKRADVVLTLIGMATIFTVDFSGLATGRDGEGLAVLSTAAGRAGCVGASEAGPAIPAGSDRCAVVDPRLSQGQHGLHSTVALERWNLRWRSRRILVPDCEKIVDIDLLEHYAKPLKLWSRQEREDRKAKSNQHSALFDFKFPLRL